MTPEATTQSRREQSQVELFDGGFHADCSLHRAYHDALVARPLSIQLFTYAFASADGSACRSGCTISPRGPMAPSVMP